MIRRHGWALLALWLHGALFGVFLTAIGQLFFSVQAVRLASLLLMAACLFSIRRMGRQTKED